MPLLVLGWQIERIVDQSKLEVGLLVVETEEASTTGSIVVLEVDQDVAKHILEAM